MQLNSLRVALLVVAVASANFSMADQKIKTKSNIKNDRVAQSSSSAACVDEKEGAADKTPCKTPELKSPENSEAVKETKGVEPAKP